MYKFNTVKISYDIISMGCFYAYIIAESCLNQLIYDALSAVIINDQTFKYEIFGGFPKNQT